MTGIRGPSIRRRAAPACSLAVVALAAIASVAADRAKPDREALRAGGLPAAVTAAADGPAMKVAAVNAARRDRVRSEAAAIDALLESRWRELGIEPSPPLDDAQFVRRIRTRR